MRRAPERILKLALLSTSYGGPALSAHESLRGAIKQIEENGLSTFLESAYNRYVDPARLNDYVLKKNYCDMAKSLRADVALRQINAILNWERFTSFNDITCPTLLLCGASDITTTPEMHKQLSQDIHHSTIIIIENCGHLILLEKPEEVNDALFKWLNTEK